MDGNENKEIIEALAAVGFETKRIELEKTSYAAEEYTGALLLRIVKKEVK